MHATICQSTAAWEFGGMEELADVPMVVEAYDSERWPLLRQCCPTSEHTEYFSCLLTAVAVQQDVSGVFLPILPAAIIGHSELSYAKKG